MEIIGAESAFGHGERTLEQRFRLPVPSFDAKDIGEVGERSDAETVETEVPGEVLNNLNRTPEDGLCFGIRAQILVNGPVSIQGVGYVQVPRPRFPLQDAQRAPAQHPCFFEPSFGVGPEGPRVETAGRCDGIDCCRPFPRAGAASGIGDHGLSFVREGVSRVPDPLRLRHRRGSVIIHPHARYAFPHRILRIGRFARQGKRA